MHPPREIDDDRYAHLRGPADPTLKNLMRWECIKLWDAAQEAVALIDDRAPTTEAEALWGDAELAVLRDAMKKHRARIAELQLMQTEAAAVIALGLSQPE